MSGLFVGGWIFFEWVFESEVVCQSLYEVLWFYGGELFI